MSAEGLSRKKELPKVVEESSVVPIETGTPEESPISDLTRTELKEKLRAVIVNIDQLAEQAARDSGERSLNASAESMTGVSGFFKRVWTQTLARGMYIQRHEAQARDAIKESGNIYAANAEPSGTNEAHNVTTEALVDRFAQEYEETVHTGETRLVIDRPGAEGLDVKGQITALMREYAAGKMSDDDFTEAKKQIFHTVRQISGSGTSDSMYADNLLEIAKQVKLAGAHAEGLKNLDLDVVLGNARESLQTEAKHNPGDRAFELAKKWHLGVLVNESTLAGAVSLAAGFATGGLKAFARSRLVAATTFGASAALSGGLIGFAENKRLKEERSQHQRDMAQGRTFERGASPRREEMDRFGYNMSTAAELTARIRDAVGDGKELDSEGIVAALDRVADAEARFQVMDRKHIDLVAYSDPTKVDSERRDLDIARGKAKAMLRKMKAASTLPEGESFDDTLQRLVDERSASLLEGESGIEEQDRLFNKMKRGRVASKAVKAVTIGLAVGTVAQEVGAFWNDDRTGIVEHLVKGASADHGETVHTTWLEGLRRMVSDRFEGVGADTQQTQALVEHINTSVSANEYLDHHNLGTHIARHGWYDNDTPKPVFDKNELKLWWGGEHNTGVDANGNYVFSAKHMLPGGSYHNGLSANAQELMKEGKLKLLLSLSQGTQAHPVELLINPDGTVTIDPKSEIGKLFFSSHEGKAQFLGRFAEVAESTGTKDGVEGVRILATHVGKGVDELTEVVTREIPAVPPRGFEIDFPPMFPVYGRKPLEPLQSKKFTDVTREYYYSGGSSEYGILDRNKYRERMSKEILANKELDVSHNDSKIVAEYLQKQDPAYISELTTMTGGARPIGEKIETVITIPAYKEGKNLEKTLRNYAKLKDKERFELVILENHPESTARDNTQEVIQRMQKEYPDLNLVHLYKTFKEKPAIGEVRKYLVDAVLLRKSSQHLDRSLAIVSNDADLEDISEEYANQISDEFRDNPELDAIAGKWDFSEESFQQFPLLHASQRLWHYFDIAFRNYHLHSPELIGRNSAFRSGIYAAVGGYNERAQLAEDLEIGWFIKEARGYDSKRISYLNPAWLISNPRRAVVTMYSDKRLIEQYGDFHVNEEVRNAPLDALLAEKRAFTVDDLQKEVQAIRSHYARWEKANGGWITDDSVEKSFTRAMRFLGVKYELKNGNVKILDASKLLKRLQMYQKTEAKAKETSPIMEKVPEELKVAEYSVPEPAPAEEVAVPKAETAAVETKEFPLSELSTIFKGQLDRNSNIKSVRKFELREGKEGLKFTIEIDTKFGDAAIDGTIASENSKLVTKGLTVEAGGLIRSRVAGAFKEVGSEIQDFFAKREGKAVAAIRLTKSGLSIDFKAAEKSVPPKA